MRWQTTLIVAALAVAACETNEATAPIEVTADDLEGTFDLLSLGGTPVNELDADYCVASTMDIVATGDNEGEFEMRHHFTERVASGVTQPCRSDPGRLELDVFWRGELENTSTLVILTIEESEVSFTMNDSTLVTTVPQNTELVGEYNPTSGRLVARFPNIWAFNPHGGSGGKISLSGDPRGLGAGTMVFDR